MAENTPSLWSLVELCAGPFHRPSLALLHLQRSLNTDLNVVIHADNEDPAERTEEYVKLRDALHQQAHRWKTLRLHTFWTPACYWTVPKHLPHLEQAMIKASQANSDISVPWLHTHNLRALKTTHDFFPPTGLGNLEFADIQIWEPKLAQVLHVLQPASALKTLVLSDYWALGTEPRNDRVGVPPEVIKLDLPFLQELTLRDMPGLTVGTTLARLTLTGVHTIVLRRCSDSGDRLPEFLSGTQTGSYGVLTNKRYPKLDLIQVEDPIDSGHERRRIPRMWGEVDEDPAPTRQIRVLQGGEETWVTLDRFGFRFRCRMYTSRLSVRTN